MRFVRPLAMVAFACIALIAWSEEPATMPTCAVCHEDEAGAFAKGAHGRSMAKVSTEVLDDSCVACHGPAAEHVDDPSSDNIRRRPEPASCLSCHPGQQGLLDVTASTHVRSGVGCLDCHSSGHGEEQADHLLEAAPNELCGECHRSEAGSFQLPYAHRDGTRPFDCTNCHSLHGDNRIGRLTMAGNGGACLDCHTEKAGPFVYPHPPRTVDGCLDCHSPHGSTNPRLLTRNRVAALCLECHADVPAFHDVSRPRYQNCQSCHAAVHGSNRDPRLIEE